VGRYADISRGARSTKTIRVPAEGEGGSLQVDDNGVVQGLAPDGYDVAVKVLTNSEEADVLAAARRRAVAKGVAEPKAGEPIYDLAVMVETVAAACFDPTATTTPFFDSADQIWNDLDRDTIAFIYQAQAAFADKCSPQVRTLSPETYVAGLALLAGEDESASIRFFERCGPGLQWNFARTLACQLLMRQTDKSGSGGTTAQ